MPTIYEDEDIDTDVADEVEDDEDIDETDEDTEEDEGDEEAEEEGESESELLAKSEIEEPSNPITLLRQKAKQDTLFRDALATLTDSADLKTESVGLTSFAQFLDILPALQEVIKMAYLNWTALKNAKQWSDVNAEVLADVDALLTTFHVTLDSKFVDWAIHAVLQLLQLTVPINAVKSIVGAASVVSPIKEEVIGIPEIKALAEAHGFVMIPEKVYKRKMQGQKMTTTPIMKKKKKGR